MTNDSTPVSGNVTPLPVRRGLTRMSEALASDSNESAMTQRRYDVLMRAIERARVEYEVDAMVLYDEHDDISGYQAKQEALADLDAVHTVLAKRFPLQHKAWTGARS